MDIVEKIKTFVKSECDKPTSRYGQEIFYFHFVPMVSWAEKLADEFGGDKEIIQLAAWLHDIGSIIYGRKDHHITGAKIAEEKLLELNYPQDKIELIKKCILNHRGSQNNKRDSIEEKIIAEADVISNFDNVGGLFEAAYLFEKLSRSEAQISVREKLKQKYNQLYFAKSKVLVKPKFEAAMLLLE